MTIHQNRPKDQYRHAPLNSLIIGAVAGVAWAVEFLLPFLFPLGNYSRNVRMALISLVLPVIGWITGVLGADSPQLYHASKEERQSQDNRRRHGGYNRNIISNHLLYFCCRYRHFVMYQIILPSVAKPSLCIWLHYLCFLSLDGDSVSRESTLPTIAIQ